MICIQSLEQTCWAAPSQWEGRTVDDRPVYIRYRHGTLTVQVGPVGASIDDALATVPIYDEDVGDKLGSVLDWDEVVDATGITMAGVE